jgi:hypothetical protein
MPLPHNCPEGGRTPWFFHLISSLRAAGTASSFERGEVSTTPCRTWPRPRVVRRRVVGEGRLCGIAYIAANISAASQPPRFRRGLVFDSGRAGLTRRRSSL